MQQRKQGYFRKLDFGFLQRGVVSIVEQRKRKVRASILHALQYKKRLKKANHSRDFRTTSDI